jgi:hypothetical protein
MIMPGHVGLMSAGGTPPPVFDADYQAVLTYAAASGYAQPSASMKQAGNALVVALKACGAWSRLDGLFPYRQAGDADFALINWKNPGNSAQRVLSPSWNSDGYSGTSTSYIDNRVVLNGSGNYQLNDAHVGMYCATLNAAGVSTHDVTGGAYMRMWWRNSGPAWRFFVNDNTNVASGSVKTDGLNILNRAASNQFKHFHNSALQTTIGRNAIQLPNANMVSCKSAHRIGLVVCGGSVEDIYADYAQALLTFIAAT